MDNKECICPHCGGKDFFIGTQSGHACIRISDFSSKAEPVKHEICLSCGTIVRSYIENPHKIASK